MGKWVWENLLEIKFSLLKSDLNFSTKKRKLLSIPV